MEKNKEERAIGEHNKKYGIKTISRINLRKEHVIFIFAVFFVASIVGTNFLKNKADRDMYDLIKDAYSKASEISEQEIYEEVKSIQENLNTDNWKQYQSQWYGFSLKYPNNFSAPKIQKGSVSSKWEYRYEFRKIEKEDDLFTGFDLLIYNVKKVKELSNIDEFPKIKNDELKNDPWCQNITGRIIETGDYPAEEIYVSPTDSCYNPALFFTFTRDEYIYVLIPTVREGVKISGDPRVEINDNFSEFLGVISTAKLINIKRSKVNNTAKINVPMPVSYKVENGRLVCAKKNDKPGKSNQDKSKHLDMECCLDPDEYPNPHCYYDPNKYGKYLK